MGSGTDQDPSREAVRTPSFVSVEPKLEGADPLSPRKVCADFHLNSHGDQLIPIHIFPTELHPKLRSLGREKTYDWIHASDLARAVDSLHAEQDKSAMLRKGIKFLAAFTLLFLCAVLGLTFLVLDMSKEIRTKDNVLTAGSTNQPVMVSSVDMQLVNGALFPRGSCTEEGQCGSPVQVGVATQSGPLSSSTSDEELASLRTLTVTSDDATLHCEITGFSRFKEQDGDLVVLFTDFGDISVRGESLSFPPQSGRHKAFERAGLLMNGGGNRRHDTRKVEAKFAKSPKSP